MTIDISEESLAKESADLLKILLKDRTTKKSIVWATHSYELLGKGFAPSDRINPSKVTGNFANLIQPRSEKSKYEQKDRTKIRAEVFTPTWLVAKQNGYVESKLGSLSLEEYVDLRWLEVTCGEAPYMVTRYDTVTGEEIPLSERVGFVDRKLQRISREVSDEVTFYKLVKDAYHASYGYEYQGDSLLLARENLLATFEDYYLAKTGNQPTLEQKKEIATIISYNVFQMDGLKKSSPYSAKQKQSQQLSLFADELEVQEVEESKTHIKDWKKNRMIGFERLSSEESEMKFDVVIGNPPYQETGEARDEPIYHYFIDEAYKIADKSILITPARFLFKAGQTPKNWMEKMLEDKHLKVQFYELKSGKVFTIFETLNGIVKKIEKHPEFETFSDLVYPQGIYRFSNKLFSDYPNAEKLQGKGTKNKIVSKSLTQLDFVFKNNEEKDHVALLGRIGSERVYRYINKKYLDLPETFENYNVFVPEANGSGALGEVLSTPLIGHTDTFLSIGNFKTKFEADACIKFIKTKFARVLLGVLKVTQHNSRKTWYYVPLQDFTVNSDIDWTQSVTDIDRQLDQKYDLSPEEIAFIENHVREMD
ncbi:TPA: Eco57I restriction-modification methylase domain-containing protein [Streptococcus pneumoniae]|nr:Eco57I restriction-modification methylase domain-containing protein [Streptococcus pneumoniae]HEU8188380.1 Eco57I restriction-modification methylase domain-containing protein [Streptococcus pneumoniae]